MENLLDAQGNRKYLTAEERRSFEAAAKDAEREARTFCLMLLNTGCRISEGLNVRVKDVDFITKSITFETLKQGKDKKGKKRKAFRQIPLSENFLDELNLVHDLKRRRAKEDSAGERIWGISRATASLRVSEVMRAAKISGIHACPLGLRHGFAVACVERKISLNIIQKWLGHRRMTTTAIYANVLGEEERKLASMLWS